jgi:hypothetical protein
MNSILVIKTMYKTKARITINLVQLGITITSHICNNLTECDSQNLSYQHHKTSPDLLVQVMPENTRLGCGKLLDSVLTRR